MDVDYVNICDLRLLIIGIITHKISHILSLHSISIYYIIHRYVYNSSLPLSHLVLDVADKCQGQTQTSQGRPFGVGLLIIGYDGKGAHLYETDPAGNYFEYFAHAIGARNQAAKTYLERSYEKFNDITSDELIQHGVNALKETVRTRDLRLTSDNTSVMIVGNDMDIKQLNDDELQPFLDKVEGDGDDDNDNDDGDDPTDDSVKPKSAMDVDSGK